MYKYVIRRVLQMIPVLLGATFIIFAMVFALPGDPTAGMCGERPCSPGFVASFRAEHNLNDPLPTQYAKYMTNLAKGDLGTTFRGEQVSDELTQRYPTTAKLALMAIIFEGVIGVLAGVLAGIRKGKFIDNLVLVSTLFVIAIPVFVIGETMQYYLGVKWNLFPVTVSSDATIYELIMPAFVLGSSSIAYAARLTRTNLVENLRADYIRTADRQGPDPASGHRASTRCATRSSRSSPSSAPTSAACSVVPSSPSASSTSRASVATCSRASTTATASPSWAP